MLLLKCQRKKFGPIFKEMLKLLPKKCSICSQIYGYGIREKPIPDPGSRGQKGTGSRIRIRNTALRCALLEYVHEAEELSVNVTETEDTVVTLFPVERPHRVRYRTLYVTCTVKLFIYRLMKCISVADPDPKPSKPFVIRPPESGSFCHQAKIIRKP
jgi:hypothetical protein